jgi:cell division protein FtsL
MASALRSERHGAVRERVHSDGGVMARPMIRSTIGVTTRSRPQLTVVPRRRRTARLVAVAAFFASSLMLGAAAFQTQLARRQVELDRIDSQIREVRNQFNELRSQRAELRSPARLAASGAALGMGLTTKTEFIEISPDVVADVQQSAGGVFDPRAESQDPVFDEFKVVKSVAGG